jgi:putative transposase
MPRPPRIETPGGIYHVFARGNRRAPIFLDDLDRRRFLDECAAVFELHDWRCGSFCLMTNHHHLLVQTREADLAAGMHRLHTRYVKWFNRRHDVDGHLFESRFKATLVDSELQLLETARYIVLNPVRAGICAHPGEWPWSSYRATVMGVAPSALLDTAWILGLFSPDPKRARERYARFIADGIVLSRAG